MILIATVAALACPASAKVVKFEITRVESPAFEGRAFGTVGTYDRIIARATGRYRPMTLTTKSSSTSTAHHVTRRA
jgi:hypothetical protein